MDVGNPNDTADVNEPAPAENAAAPASDWPASVPLPPSREDIDLLRDSQSYTPAEINAFVDGHRPTWVAAGFSDQQIDDYYGIENFDFKAAVNDILAAAHQAAKEPFNPQFLIGNIRRNFPDPQQRRQQNVDIGDIAAQVGRNSVNVGLEYGAAEAADSLFSLVAPLEEASAVPLLLGAAGLSTLRAVVRQKLVESQQAGMCGNAHSFRNTILDTLAQSDSIVLPDKVDGWISDAVRDVMTNKWSRERLADHPAMEALAALPRKAASALLWALYDKDMPADRDFYNAAFLAWAKATGFDNPDRDTSEPPDMSRLSHTRQNASATPARTQSTHTKFMA